MKNNAALVLLFLGLMAISGCATVKGGDSTPGAKSLEQVLKDGGHTDATAPSAMQDNGDIYIRGIKLKNNRFDIPITINSRVEYWVDYFTGKGRPHFQRYLERSEFFIPYMKPLLKQNGMPEDLVYLAMIESGFNNFARSRAAAVGPWQFISATGKRYGLSVNWWVDERRDIHKSTLAAVDYLRDLYNLFDSWELAAAAYNSGEAKIARGIQRFGTRDFWVIAKHRFLRPETRDYVPKIIAAALLGKNADQFGFTSNSVKPSSDEAVAPDGELIKVIKTDKPLEDEVLKKPQPLAETAPAPKSDKGEEVASRSRNGVGPADDDDEFDEDDDAPTGGAGITPATLTVPVDNAPVDSLVVSKDKDEGTPQPLAKPVPTPHVSKSGQVGGEELAEFEVQSPADLLKIARAAGLSYMTVKSLNPEILRWCTPPSSRSYRVKLPASVKDKFLSTYNHAAFPRKVQFMAYKVRSGETITHVARHFGIKVDPISDLNGISSRAPLRQGFPVILPIPNDRSRSLASLDVRDPPERHRGRRGRRRHRRIRYKARESARARGGARSTQS